MHRKSAKRNCDRKCQVKIKFVNCPLDKPLTQHPVSTSLMSSVFEPSVVVAALAALEPSSERKAYVTKWNDNVSGLQIASLSCKWMLTTNTGAEDGGTMEEEPNHPVG